jgi:hypothetical protein
MQMIENKQQRPILITSFSAVFGVAEFELMTRGNSRRRLFRRGQMRSLFHL